MDGEIDGVEETSHEQRGEQSSQATRDERSQQRGTLRASAASIDEEIRAAPAERDEKIVELEAQVIEVSNTVGAAEVLARQIDE